MNFFERVNAMTPVEALTAYLDHGKTVFPVRPFDLDEDRRAKAPLVPWKTYQTTCATPYEVRRWIERWPELALGFPTGAYNGYNVLDADTPCAEEWLREHAPATPLVQRTRKGLHRFYRIGSFKVPTVTGIGPVPGIDARGEGGFVVIAPSVIAGHHYQWILDVQHAHAEHPGLDGPDAHPDRQVPTLDALGEAFFTRSGTTPGQKGVLRPHGPRNAPSGAFSHDQRYNDDGLVAIGCRDVFMRDVVLGLVASHVRDFGTLPDADYIAARAWEIFCDRADRSDGIPKFEHCLEKAIYTIRRVGDGTLVVDDDSEIGDAAAYEEMAS